MSNLSTTRTKTPVPFPFSSYAPTQKKSGYPKTTKKALPNPPYTSAACLNRKTSLKTHQKPIHPTQLHLTQLIQANSFLRQTLRPHQTPTAPPFMPVRITGFIDGISLLNRAIGKKLKATNSEING